jgi:hypothetical protein
MNNVEIDLTFEHFLQSPKCKTNTCPQNVEPFTAQIENKSTT